MLIFNLQKGENGELNKTKIWVGPEREGLDKGILTMFVKSEYPGVGVINYLSDSRCKRLYLGAGREDVKEFSNELINYCIDEGIKIVVETTPPGLKNIPKEILNLLIVILRIELTEAEQLVAQDHIKIDTFQTVYMSEVKSMIKTGLDDLHGDMFGSDVLIFNGEVN